MPLLLLLLFFTTGEGAISSHSLLPRPSNKTINSCFIEGITWSSQESSDIIPGVSDPYSCQQLCLNSDSCLQFTWFNQEAVPFDLICFLFVDPAEGYDCTNCVSGPTSCTCSGTYSCQITPQNFIAEIPAVENEVLCHDYCSQTNGCKFYTWFDEDIFPLVCFMFSSCEEKELSCKSCHSGPVDCENISIITSTSSLASSTMPPPITSTIPSPSSTTVSPSLSCFDEDKTWSSDYISSTFPSINSAISCQEKCEENSDSCTDFTWYSANDSPFHNTCVLFLKPSSPTMCSHCFSGPLSCLCGSNYACEIDDNLVDVLSPIENEILCQDKCAHSPACSFYTFFDISSHPLRQTCLLLSSCNKLDFSCEGCASGPDNCRNINSLSTFHPSPSTTTWYPTTTSPIIPTTPPTTCDTLAPEKHGDWFCPPCLHPLTCHLECHPGYVSTNATVITCDQGQWTESPNCIPAVAIIAGNAIPGSTVEVYGEGLHKKLDNLPHYRFYHSLDLVNSVLLLCGGQHTFTSCLSFSPSLQWTFHSSTTSQHSSHSSVSIVGQLYLLGGSGSSSKSITETLTPPSHNWTRGWNLLEPSESACAAKIDSQAFMLTGGSYLINSAILYNVTNGEATRLQNLIMPRQQHGCVYIKNPETMMRGVLVAGGFGGSHLSDSEMYDLETGEWTATGSLTSQRDGVKMVVLGENILALGGYDGQLMSTVDKFNLTSREWSPTEQMLEARYHHAVTGVPPSLVENYINFKLGGI